MADATPVPVEAPPRRRTNSWNLRNIVEDIAGRPIEELQEPGRPVHPYLQAAPPPSLREPVPDGPSGRPDDARAGASPTSDDAVDPVARIHPPLVGELGRSFHGSEHEHHRATLEAIATGHDPPSPGAKPHAPGPSRRPERIYLHYLLLHMDRLTDAALRYLQRAVDEEVEHRKL